MRKINVKEARQQISRLLDEVNAGEEIIIIRRGKPVARLIQMNGNETKQLHFPDRSELRRKLPPMTQSSVSLIRDIRNERG